MESAENSQPTPPPVTATEIAEMRRQYESAMNELTTRTAEVAAIAAQLNAARTQIVDTQAVIGTKSAHIEDAQVHADTVRGNLDRLQTAINQQANDVAAARDRAQAAVDSATELLTAVKAAKGNADAEAAASTAAKRSADEAAEQTKSLALKAQSIEAKVTEYEARLIEFQEKISGIIITTEELLRGATTAGLATAFNKRGQTFLLPYQRWQTIFVGSLVLIVFMAITGLIQATWGSAFAPSYDELLRLWLTRLPIAGALIWLALHSSHEAALAKRLEEDYGYKSAIATAFEGFRKEMSAIGTDIPRDSQLAVLCQNTLAIIASPPGRIYDKHALTKTPTGEIKGVVGATAEAVNAVKGPQG